MGPIFNVSFVEKRGLWVCEQCTGPTEKKEKKKRQMHERGMQSKQSLSSLMQIF